MFGSIIRFAFRERAPWILFLRGMIGCVVFSLASMSQSQTLRNLSAPTIPNRSASPQVNFTQAYDPAGSANNPDTIRVVGLSPKSVYREAAAGHPLYYILSVSNLGNVEDQYTLSAVGNRWPLTLLSADSLTKIAMTAVVAPDSQFQFVIKLDVPGNAAIGTIDTVRMIVHSMGSPAVTDFAVLTTSSLGPAAGLPWIESFPQPFLDRVRWPYNSGPAAVNEKAVNKPSPPYALNFDGYLLGGDEVRSQPINLAGKCDVVLLFAVERGGAGNATENGDDFFVDYFNADGEWINLLVLPGGGPVMTSFSVESVVLPADACHSSFRFRFRNLATVGPFDDWYVDDVKVFEMARGRIPFVETFPTSILDTDKWPVNTGTLVDTLGQNAPSPPFSANLKGNSILQTQPLDLSFQSAVAVTYYFQQQGFGDDPEAGDDLIVEFRDARGDWMLLAQHLGVTGSLPNFTRQELILPPAAYHRDFRLRFRATGDVGFDDWFVDDVTIDVFSPPEIEVTPTTLAATLFVGDSTMREFTIHNTGAGELFYRLRVAPASLTTPNFKTSVFASAGSLPALQYPKDFYQLTLKKNESDWRVGQRVIANSGGPDDFGYTWRDSREAGGPVFGWIDIAATGKRIGSQPDDDNVGPFDIGFAFPFYDSVFTKFRFCTNGFISFTSNSSRFTNDPLPSGGVGDLVAPFWDDLDLSAPQSAAYYLADGKRLIVQWTNVMSSGGGGPYTFQLILTPAGNIIFQYLKMGAPVNFSTIGIQNHDGSEGLEIAFNADFVKDGLAVRIARPASWLRFAPVFGKLAAGSHAPIQVKFNATGLIPDSTYRTELRVQSNDLDEEFLAVRVALEVLSLKTEPIHFEFDTTKVRYLIRIDNATLDDQPLEAGDEIGVLTPTGLVAGGAVWTGTAPVRFFAYGDDLATTKIEGFKSGETMYFRIWDRHLGQCDYPATPTYKRGDGRFGTGDSAHVAQLAAKTHFARQSVLKRGWSWISFNVLPDERNVEQLMAGVSNLAIMVDGEGRFYIPGQINAIGELNVLEGYKVYLNAPDSVNVTGREVLPNTPVPLRQTWNFTGFLPMVPINAEKATASIASNLVLIKNDAGGFYIPAVINTLGNLQPGAGYRIYMRMADTLIYPYGSSAVPKSSSSGSADLLPVTTTLPAKHFAPILTTAESYSLVIVSASVNGKPLQPGDEVGVFTSSGRLVGAGVWPEKGPLGISVWRCDGEGTQAGGFVPGDKMVFRLWRRDGFEGQAGREEMAVSAKFLHGDGTFDSEVYSIVELEANPLPQKFHLHQNFPNPFSFNNRLANDATAQTLIRYELPRPGFVELRVYNLLGQAVKTLKNELQPAGFHEVTWNGRDEQGRLVAGGVYLYRLHVRSDRNDNDFVAVRKVVVVP